MSSVFGLNECNELVHVSEVGRGLACQCRCVACGEPLMARQGAVRDHHFAHASNLDACESSFESLLHQYAKQLVVQAGGLQAPVTPGLADFFGWGEGATEQWLQARGPVQQEVAMGVIRPDLLVATDDGVQVAIEIAYSSFCDAEKVLVFKQMSLPAMEIDLSNFLPESFDVTAVRHSVIDAIDRKRWVWPDSALIDPEAAAATTPPPAPTKVQASEISSKPTRLPEEIINFGGRWVSVRQFPSGDIAVKVVAWDPDLVSLIRSIAKAHGGRYNAQYKTWNIPRWAANMVRNELQHKSRTMHIAMGPANLDPLLTTHQALTVANEINSIKPMWNMR